MSLPEIKQANGLESLSRRALFSIFPAGMAGCLTCARAAACGQTSQPLPSSHDWTEKADMTWEQIFRFAYQKDLIPLLKQMKTQLGSEKFIALLREASDEVVRKKTANRPPTVRDLSTFAAGMKQMPPIFQHALDAEIVEQSPAVFEYRVKKCLWAKTFRDEDAGDIGYAMVCYPDYAVAKNINPKLRLVRNKTLMQGDNICTLRYTMDA